MKKTQNIRTRIVHENLERQIREVIQMKKENGLRSWAKVILMVVAGISMSLFLSQMAGAAKISATVGTGGSISPSGSVTVIDGTAKTFTITPNASYAIATLTVNGFTVQPARTYKFTAVSGDLNTISVTFAPDRDNDGISDDQEINGITLAGTVVIPGSNSGQSRDSRLDPDSKDLFVILAPVETPLISKFPANPLEYVLKSQSLGGLGFITIHEIPLSQTQGDRFLNSFSAQKAVRVTESLDTLGTELGISTCGTPDQDKGTVYTQRIINHLTTIWKSTPPPDLIDKYIKHTIAHEIGHMVGPLAPAYNSAYGGYHYKSEANDKLLNQSVYYKGTTFYIGTSFTSADQAGVKLK